MLSNEKQAVEAAGEDCLPAGVRRQIWLAVSETVRPMGRATRHSQQCK